jgi:hypothetical protein
VIKIDQLIEKLKDTSCSGKMVIPLNMGGEKILKDEIIKIIIEEVERSSQIGYSEWLNALQK